MSIKRGEIMLPQSCWECAYISRNREKPFCVLTLVDVRGHLKTRAQECPLTGAVNQQILGLFSINERSKHCHLREVKK